MDLRSNDFSRGFTVQKRLKSPLPDFFHHLLYRAFDRKEKISVSQRESASKWILYGREFTI